jgi:hypothetical protein
MIAEIALDVFRDNLSFPPNFFHHSCGREGRRVSTTLRQCSRNLVSFSSLCLSPVFRRKISRQERLRATIPDPIDLQHPPFCLSSSAFRFSKVDRRWQLIAS